jgi:phage tail sheath protein FI
MRKFVLGFQSGFDGQSPAIPINVGGDISPGNTQGLNCATSGDAGSIAYNQCITALGNADEWDINLIVVPGIVHQHHPYITNLVVDMCEKRGDCFFIMDMYVDDGNPSAGQVDEVVSYAGAYDTSYAATYYPWVKILDINTNQIVTVPPSVIIPSVYAASDKVSAEWFAPAGLNRGGIPIATQVTDRTTHEERDTLYEGKVNPIAAFPGVGIVVWGQKTLQVKSSALDRVSVRRLLINLKKFIASSSKYLVFEQNVASTRNKFLSIVNPYLESVQQRSGLYAFFVKMDESNNTPDIIDRNILYGQIYLKPTRTAEFIVLDFNILPTGASFPGA